MAATALEQGPVAGNGGVRLRLPATSANLGPGFDALGLAMSAHLTVEAELSKPGAGPSINATGRNADLVGTVERNLILETFQEILAGAGVGPMALALRIDNGIPLGMGMGSSAAALCAGVALANHFADLGMDAAAIVAEASRLEGHPDNVAACWYGGMTVSVQDGEDVQAATFAGDPAWRLRIALPGASLATQTARALLPDTYSRADAVFNLSRSSLVTAAFASRRLDLLRLAMRDRIHQPFREQACPLLGRLLPLQEHPAFAGVALSGAGPSVLLILAAEADESDAATVLQAAAGEPIEILPLHIAGGATVERL